MKFLLIFLLLLAVYGIFIEPFCLKIRYFHIARDTAHATHLLSSKAFSETAAALTIVHLSDSHFAWYYSTKRWQKLLYSISQTKPDLILFTGDLIDDYRYWQKRSANELISLLQSLEAPLGKYAVLGNHDYRWEAKDWVKAVLTQGGFTILENQEVTLFQQGTVLSISGTDDYQEGSTQKALRPAQADFKLLLAHEPDQIDELRYLQEYDLVLSGHSHGGQIRLPFYRKRNVGSRHYTFGTHQLNGTVLSISSGLGMTGLPLRLGVLPEIIYYRLPQKET